MWKLGALYKSLTRVRIWGSKVKVIGDKKKRKTAKSSPLTMHSRACVVGHMQQAATDDTIAWPPAGDGLHWWDNQRMLSIIINTYVIAAILILLHEVSYAMQGLYEYVRPSWEERPRPKVDELDMKSFGSTTPAWPTGTDSTVTELQIDGTVLPA